MKDKSFLPWEFPGESMVRTACFLCRLRAQVQPLVGELRFCKGEKKEKESKEGRERVRKGGKKEGKKEGNFF